MKKIYIILFCIIFQKTLGAETRFLQPPSLGKENIGRKIICYRPMRSPTPNFSVQEKGEKILVHNYGHGGAGWSLSTGSTAYAYNLFMKDFPINKKTPIAIVGSGCIGLFTAYHLLEKGHTNITLYAKDFNDLTSHHAGGLLSFRANSDYPYESKVMIKMMEETYSFFNQIARKKHPDFFSGASILPTYFKSIGESELEELVGRGMKPCKNIQVDFGTGTVRSMIVYDDSIFIDTEKMMHQLRLFLIPKIHFQEQTIHSFEQLEESVVFNCAGLGAKELNQDFNLYPVQGHLVMLKNQASKTLDYMLIHNFYTPECFNEKVIRTLDFFPKKNLHSSSSDIGVLGGTFIKKTNPLESNPQEFDLIIKRAREFFYKK